MSRNKKEIEEKLNKLEEKRIDEVISKCENTEEIGTLYIQGYYNKETREIEYPSIVEIARRLGLDRSELSRIAVREKWDTLRALFQQKRVEKNIREQKMLLISEGTRFDQKQLRNYEKIIGIVERKLDREYGEKIVQSEDGVVSVEVVQEISPKDLNVLANTLVTCRNQVKDIIGEEKLAIEIANEIENERKALKEGESAEEKLLEIEKEIKELRREKSKRKVNRDKDK